MKTISSLSTLVLLTVLTGCGGGSDDSSSPPPTNNSGSGSGGSSGGGSGGGSSGGSTDICDAPGSPSSFVELGRSITYTRNSSGNETFWYCLKDLPSRVTVLGTTSCSSQTGSGIREGSIDFRLYDANEQSINRQGGSVSGNMTEISYTTRVFNSLNQGKYFLRIDLRNSVPLNRFDIFFTDESVDPIFPYRWLNDKGISIRDCSEL